MISSNFSFKASRYGFMRHGGYLILEVEKISSVGATARVVDVETVFREFGAVVSWV